MRIPINLYVTPEMYEEFKAKCAAQGLTMSGVMRALLRRFLRGELTLKEVEKHHV
jgi:hypothetical protein